jgi:hypothetical protein
MPWLLIIVILVGAWMVSRMKSEVDARVKKIAEAIATAEGYYVPGSLPQRLNNPGSLKGADGALLTFATPQDGWQALYHQVELILSGGSKWYRPDMTINEIAQIYTGGDKPDAWARIVSWKLGVTPDTPVSEVV